MSSSSHYYPIKSSQSNPANPSNTIRIQRYPAIQGYSNTIQPIQSGQSIHNPASQYDPTFSSYTTYPDDAPSSDFPPSPAASADRHLISSSAAESSAAFYASNLDGDVSKANFLAFLISSPTGQSLYDMRNCCIAVLLDIAGTGTGLYRIIMGGCKDRTDGNDGLDGALVGLGWMVVSTRRKGSDITGAPPLAGWFLQTRD